jgi:hypothetical protein
MGGAGARRLINDAEAGLQGWQQGRQLLFEVIEGLVAMVYPYGLLREAQVEAIFFRC